MDKVRIVVEYNQLPDERRQAYLFEQGISAETFEGYRQQAAAVIGVDSVQTVEKSRCEELIEQLGSTDESVRRASAKELGRMRGDSVPAIEALVDRMLNDEVEFVRNWSAWSLVRIEPKHLSVVDAFLQVMQQEPVSTVQTWSIIAVSASKTDYVKTRLLEIIERGEPFARLSAINALFRMDSDTSSFHAIVQEALDSDDESLQRQASTILAEIESAQ